MPTSETAATTGSNVVIILGMHRSGTSALAGCLEEAGLYLGPTIRHTAENEKGYRENRAITTFHELLFAANGGSWRNPPSRLIWGREYRKIRDLIVGRFSSHKRWGFKDPRTLFTLEGWLEILPGARMIGIFRHPRSVALSLSRRNGMQPAEGERLWFRYNQRLLETCEMFQIPLLDYDNDIAFHRGLSVASRWLGLEQRSGKFFEARLRHFSHGEEGEDQCKRLYNSLRSHSDQWLTES